MVENISIPHGLLNMPIDLETKVFDNKKIHFCEYE
jgi:hypothetical protein